MLPKPLGACSVGKFFSTNKQVSTKQTDLRRSYNGATQALHPGEAGQTTAAGS